MSKVRGKQLEKRALIKCPIPECNEGLYQGMFSAAECHNCNGLGMVDDQTGEALPEREVIRQLQIRLKERRSLLVELQAELKRLRKIEHEHNVSTGRWSRD